MVTFDALHSQTAHARFLVEDKNAHYIAVIKANQPLLHQRLKRLSWRDVPLLGKTRATAHGRDEIRRVKTATVTGLYFPHATQAVQIVRRRRTVTTGKVTLERVYAEVALHVVDQISFLEFVDDIAFIGDAADGQEALEKLGAMNAHGELPDVVLLDLHMPRLDGVQTVAAVAERYPQVRTVVLTGFSEIERVHAALAHGTSGYVLKDASPDEVEEAIKLPSGTRSPSTRPSPVASPSGSSPRRTG
ncbi:response regulator [Streptomyces mirabilis]|uniref:response regulator n=1 Tax=Streptomyces mirabilis TaxID=68239 RepID=UPI0036503E84